MTTTTTLAQTQTLLAATMLLAAMATVVWVGMALVARLAPRASWAIAAANAAMAAGLALHGLRATLPEAPLTQWPADALMVAAFGLLRAAVPAIATRQLAWRSAAAVLIVCVLLLAPLPYGGDLGQQARIVSAAATLLMLLAALDARRHLREARVRRRTVAVLASPLFLIAALMSLLGLETLVHPGLTAGLLLPTDFNSAFLWGTLLLTLLQNATLAFLVLMRLILRIRHLTEHDPLTGVLNRRAFGQALDAAHAWLRRGRGYALVMMDMDRFKQLNDTLGHAAGDAALQQFARELQPCLREIDRFGRLGGEEFCVLLPDTDIAGAALVAERMRTLVDTQPLSWHGQDWRLSASFGVAEAEPADPRHEAVLGRADAALYRAKHQGRNLVQA
jgi:diguanylate cyclase (GGDEF)-like protein